MHNSLKIIKTLLYSYSAIHVSGTLAPIIRSILILHIQPPVTVYRWVCCILSFGLSLLSRKPDNKQQPRETEHP
jgi:hypothetical protein